MTRCKKFGEVLDGQHAMMGAAARRAVEASHQWSATLRPLDRLFGVASPGPGMTQPEPTHSDLPV